MGKRKYLGNANDNYIKSFKPKIIKVDEEDIKGYASYVKIKEVYRPLIADDICIFDKGYSYIGFFPDREYWALWAFYNDKDDIIQWYFDVTKKNSIDEEGNPYCDDLYLDIVLTPDGKILILDEDELKTALDNDEITLSEFDMAYNVLATLKESEMLNVAYMQKLCLRLRSLFTKINGTTNSHYSPNPE